MLIDGLQRAYGGMAEVCAPGSLAALLLVGGVSAWLVGLNLLAQAAIGLLALLAPLAALVAVLGIPGIVPAAVVLATSYACDQLATALAPRRVPWSVICTMLACVVVIDRAGRAYLFLLVVIVGFAVPGLVILVLPWLFGCVEQRLLPAGWAARCREHAHRFVATAVPAPVRLAWKQLAALEQSVVRALAPATENRTGPMDAVIAVGLIAGAVGLSLMVSIYVPARIVSDLGALGRQTVRARVPHFF